MKLDRNCPSLDSGKYAVVKLRDLRSMRNTGPAATYLQVKRALAVLDRFGLLNYGEPWKPGEFFVLMLKDEFAEGALREYASAALTMDAEYANEVSSLANRSGLHSPFCKRPD